MRKLTDDETVESENLNGHKCTTLARKNAISFLCRIFPRHGRASLSDFDIAALLAMLQIILEESLMS